jgi:hypothetical protein
VFQLRFVLAGVGVALALFVGILAFVEIGRQLAQWRLRRNGGAESAGIVDNSVYGLLALLIGFTFSGAANRLDHRRELLGKEANAVSTFWQRIDLLPPERQPAVRDDVRRYLDAVLGWYTATQTTDAMFAQPSVVTRARDELWKRAVEACLAPQGEPARQLLLTAANELFDAVDQERMARRMHPPGIVWVMLGITALAAALFVGHGLVGTHNWLYITGFAASIAVATYVIIELEFPRLGFTQLADIDRPLVEVRATLR